MYSQRLLSQREAGERTFLFFLLLLPTQSMGTSEIYKQFLVLSLPILLRTHMLEKLFSDLTPPGLGVVFGKLSQPL